VLTDTELTSMLRAVAHEEATRYYKLEEKPQPVLVVKSVFMAVLSAVTVAFIRAGVSEERFNSLDGIPDEIANEMKLVGWDLDSIAQYFNTD
jgi:hypothetical protein